jgi:glutaconate CoA-transferase subunit A
MFSPARPDVGRAVAVVPRGAWSGSMHPYYGVDYPAVEAYMKDEPKVLEAHLAAAPEAQAQQREYESKTTAAQ